jgi:hypothetical protein
MDCRASLAMTADQMDCFVASLLAMTENKILNYRTSPACHACACRAGRLAMTEEKESNDKEKKLYFWFFGENSYKESNKN